jgi:hypothetical protein
VGHAEGAVASAVVVEVPFLTGVDLFVTTGAGRFAGIHERGDRCAAALVRVAPAAAAGGARCFAAATRWRHLTRSTWPMPYRAEYQADCVFNVRGIIDDALWYRSRSRPSTRGCTFKVTTRLSNPNGIAIPPRPLPAETYTVTCPELGLG